LIIVLVLMLGGTASPLETVPWTKFEKIRHQVGWYESRNNHNVKPGDNGLAFGKYQFHKRTFNWVKGLAGMPDLNIAIEKDQEILLKWAIENGYGRHWSCIKDGRVKLWALMQS